MRTAAVVVPGPLGPDLLLDDLRVLHHHVVLVARTEVAVHGHLAGDGDQIADLRTRIGDAARRDVFARYGLDLMVERNRIDLPEHSFTADVFGAKVDFASSTRSFVDGFFQYNAASEEVVMNLRWNFIHSPLSDLFLVYSERRDGDEGYVLERTVTVKMTKLLSF